MSTITLSPLRTFKHLSHTVHMGGSLGEVSEVDGGFGTVEVVQ